MTRSLRLLLLLAVTAISMISFEGCIFSPKKDPPENITEYKSQTSPENVVNNLQVSYRLKDIEQYSRLLAPEFIFKFQPADAQDIETEFWTRDQDTTGTEALFSTPLVSNITIDLIHGSAQTPADIGFDPGTLWIRINQTQLAVDQTDGISWLVQDTQDMFFRKGMESASEDTTLWFLIEWRDIPTAVAPRIGVDPLASGELGPVRPTSWGALRKSLFTDTP